MCGEWRWKEAHRWRKRSGNNNNNNKNWANEAYEYIVYVWESPCLKPIFKVVTCICRASSTIFLQEHVYVSACSRAVPSIQRIHWIEYAKKQQLTIRKTKHTLCVHCFQCRNATQTRLQCLNEWKLQAFCTMLVTLFDLVGCGMCVWVFSLSFTLFFFAVWLRQRKKNEQESCEA